MHKTVADIVSKKNSGKKISVITAYDYSMATLCDRAGIDILLVGDSAGMVMLGYENTIPVTMDQMCLFTEAVSRARQNSLIVADLPFLPVWSLPLVFHPQALLHQLQLLSACQNLKLHL